MADLYAEEDTLLEEDEQEFAEVESEADEEDLDGEEEAESEEDLFPLLDEESDAKNDPEELQMYQDYLALNDEISNENALIMDIKTQIKELCERRCKNKKDTAELNRLRICLEQETIKLRGLLNCAISLQNSGSPRLYGEIEVPTTLEEDFSLPQKCYVCPNRNNVGTMLCDIDYYSSDDDEE